MELPDPFRALQEGLGEPPQAPKVEGKGMKRISKFMKDCSTESDNATFDIFRIVFAISMLVFLGATLWTVFKSGAFSAQDFGNGFATLFGSGAAGTGIKSRLEGPASPKE